MRSTRFVFLFPLVLGVCLAAGCVPGRTPAAGVDPTPEPSTVLPPPETPEPSALFSPAGTPERPVLVSAVIRIGEAYATGGQLLGEFDCSGGGEYVAGVTGFHFHARLSPAPPSAWYRENVRVEGGDCSLREDLFAGGMVEVPVSEGKEGDRVTVTIGAVVLPGREGDALVVTLRRVEEPRARLEVWEGGAWREAATGQVLGQRPLKLRISFSRDMQPPTVEPFLNRTPYGRWVSGPIYRPVPGELTWLDGRTLLWEMAEPPPVLVPCLQNARDVDGLWVLGGLPVVYTGEPPRLYARDSPAGSERPVGVVPTDISRAMISPGGKDLLAWGYEVTTARHGPRWLTGVADLARGGWRWVTSDGSWTYVGWVSERAVLRIGCGLYQVMDLEETVLKEGALPEIDRLCFPVLSPDGGRLAFLVTDWSHPQVENSRYPMHLAVVDLGTGDIAWTRDFARYYRPPTCGWRSLAPPAWSPDGKRLAALSDLAQGAAVRVLDLGTGEVHTAVVLADAVYGTSHRFAWSPTGEYWLVGDRLVATAPPHAVTPGRGHGHEPEHWSPDGRWLTGGGWEDARLHAVETGAVEQLAGALPCGWDAAGRLYLVRWPDAEYRYIYQEP